MRHGIVSLGAERPHGETPLRILLQASCKLHPFLVRVLFEDKNASKEMELCNHTQSFANAAQRQECLVGGLGIPSAFPIFALDSGANVKQNLVGHTQEHDDSDRDGNWGIIE